MSSTFQSHGIIVCAGNDDPNTGACTPGTSRRNKISHNLIVDNGQNLDGDFADSGISLVGNVFKNDVYDNMVLQNNGDGISVRHGASDNNIKKNSSLFNTSTDATAAGYPPTGMPGENEERQFVVSIGCRRSRNQHLDFRVLFEVDGLAWLEDAVLVNGLDRH